MRHKWTSDELAIIANNKNSTATKIKLDFFASSDDITSKAIQRKKDLLRGSTLLRNNHKIDQNDVNMIVKYKGSSNEYLSNLLQRRPDDIDKLKHMIKNKKLPRRLVLPATSSDIIIKPQIKDKESSQIKKQNLAAVINLHDLEDEIKQGYAALDVIKSIKPEAIELDRARTKRFKDNSDLVALHDWFKVPRTHELPLDTKKLLRILKESVISYNHKLNNIPANKSAAVSTQQNNILRMIAGSRITSFRNLNIHNPNSTDEMHAVYLAIKDYVNSSLPNLKANPSSKILNRETPINNKVVINTARRINDESVITDAIELLYSWLTPAGQGYQCNREYFHKAILESSKKLQHKMTRVVDNVEIHKLITNDSRFIAFKGQGNSSTLSHNTWLYKAK